MILVEHVIFSGGDLSSNGQGSLSLTGSNSNATGIISRDSGCTAVRIEGGDKKTLVRGQLSLTHSNITRFAR
jgi:hypothetical protein